MSTSRRKSNCPNCGAVLNDFRCEYCGTIVHDFTYADVEKPFYLRLKIDDKIHTVGVYCSNVSIKSERLYDCCLRDDDGIFTRSKANQILIYDLRLIQCGNATIQKEDP